MWRDKKKLESKINSPENRFQNPFIPNLDTGGEIKFFKNQKFITFQSPPVHNQQNHLHKK